jgi:hypothetical protein
MNNTIHDTTAHPDPKDSVNKKTHYASGTHMGPSLAKICFTQSRVLLYSALAFSDCMRVLTVSWGIVTKTDTAL